MAVGRQPNLKNQIDLPKTGHWNIKRIQHANVGCREGNSQKRGSASDQQGTTTFVLDTSRRLDAKISSSRSTSEIETFRCQALAQRNQTATKGSFLKSNYLSLPANQTQRVLGTFVRESAIQSQ